MKKIYKLFLICWVIFPAIGFSQLKNALTPTYVTGLKYTFSAGSVGGWTCNEAPDYDITKNTISGFVSLINSSKSSRA